MDDRRPREPATTAFLASRTRQVADETLTYIPDWDLALAEHAAQLLRGRVVDERKPRPRHPWDDEIVLSPAGLEA